MMRILLPLYLGVQGWGAAALLATPIHAHGLFVRSPLAMSVRAMFVVVCAGAFCATVFRARLRAAPRAVYDVCTMLAIAQLVISAVLWLL